jgi:prepilin-type N-terminal cleavage/methylation domain-containing protein
MSKLEKSVVPTPTRPRPRGRSAFTLAELMMVAALLSMLLAFVASYLVGMHRYDAKFRKGELNSMQLNRLADSVRTDIRLSSAVSLADDQVLLVAMLDGHEIRYELVAEGCRRSAGNPNDAATRFDLFRVPLASAWMLEVGPPGRRPLQVVSLRSKERVPGQPSRVLLLVHAALGADLIQQPSEAN